VWIVVRLVLAGIGFVIRQLSRGRVPKLTLTFEGTPYFEKIRYNKRNVTGFTLGMARKSPSWVRLHAESRIDRWFKRVGVANEIQTGDAAFDDRVYVTCDHPFVATVLRESSELRAAIVAAFEAGYDRIAFDGATVRIERASSMPPTPWDQRLLKTLWETSWRLEDELPSRFADPFLWKALVVEGVVWSILGFAIGAGIQLLAHTEDFHVWQRDVFKLGAVVAAAAFAVLIALVILWMRGSSRGHRVIVESMVVLLIGLPIAAMQVVGDTNRALDHSTPLTLERRIEQCEVRVHRDRKGRRSYSYYLWITQEAEQTGPKLPRDIETTSTLCKAASPGGTVQIELGRGRWGIPWYRSLRVGDVTWQSPL
jgi:hypothetical protein